MTLDTVRKIARNLLERNTVKGVLGLAADDAGVIPRVFDTPDAVGILVLEPKWVLAKIAVTVMARESDDYRLAVVCRGCDERALIELGKRNRIDPGRLHLIGVACSEAQAKQCLCQRPWPSRVDAGEKAVGVDLSQSETVRQYLGADRPVRLERWREAFSRCIKCYGCRNACPVCICDTCKLEQDVWVKRGEIAPDMLTFHLMRSMHVADACVACGACEDACPVGIPLMLLQLPMRNALRRSYNYEAGTERERLSPLLSNYIDEPSHGISIPDWTDSLEEKPWDLIS
ncbi:Fe-S oxidoreductase [Desulfosarcina widdelii]|uniref:Fe-S oxidoreductase n=1 Tax=Desulfosarcina widdelii TaxID=947919 RepID=A0A5K7Z368_9BACT|nr:4Fe-4S dicluster domain-containing protein [Desulfosarcina widdelii]BBO74709.1 Fe-S oxidoreductase [Desulfosarcina widdelii]